jgi:hypothetical protein
MDMDGATLKSSIEQAFAGVEPPPPWSLVNSHEGTEPALLADDFKDKSDWRALDAAFIDQAPDGFGTALSFFSDEAFRYYLPAYLLADLDGKLQQADPVFALTHGLESSSRDEKINPRRYGERTWFDHARHKFAMFTRVEKDAVASYLFYKSQRETLTDLEKQRIQEALENYWQK